MARPLRMKLERQNAVYHCISRIVGGDFLLNDSAKEMFRRQMWQISQFCGVEILTYCVLSNHFHILIRVPHVEDVDDCELLRRVKVLYRNQPRQIEYYESLLKGSSDNENYQEARQRLLARMHDVSMFMKELKQRFTTWYNKSKGRKGTLWAERFKSVLFADQCAALRSVAGYIDLNSVRAGLSQDPKDYRWSGYAEAVDGNMAACQGLNCVMLQTNWNQTQEEYRQLLYGVGSVSKKKGGGMRLNMKDVEQVLNGGGHLPLPTVLRCRVRYLTDGLVLGTEDFVSEQLQRYDRKVRWLKPLRGSNWGLCIGKNMREAVFGQHTSQN